MCHFLNRREVSDAAAASGARCRVVVFVIETFQVGEAAACQVEPTAEFALFARDWGLLDVAGGLVHLRVSETFIFKL